MSLVCIFSCSRILFLSMYLLISGTICSNNFFSKERDKVNKQLEKLRDLYVNDLIQIDHYEKQYKELTSKLDSLKEEEKPVEEKKTVNYDEFKSFLSRDFVSLYNNLSRTEKRLIWASVIDTIYIDDNYNLRIVFI